MELSNSTINLRKEKQSADNDIKDLEKKLMRDLSQLINISSYAQLYFDNDDFGCLTEIFERMLALIREDTCNRATIREKLNNSGCLIDCIDRKYKCATLSLIARSYSQVIMDFYSGLDESMPFDDMI